MVFRFLLRLPAGVLPPPNEEILRRVRATFHSSTEARIYTMVQPVVSGNERIVGRCQRADKFPPGVRLSSLRATELCRLFVPFVSVRGVELCGLSAEGRVCGLKQDEDFPGQITIIATVGAYALPEDYMLAVNTLNAVGSLTKSMDTIDTTWIPHVGLEVEGKMTVLAHPANNEWLREQAEAWAARQCPIIPRNAFSQRLFGPTPDDLNALHSNVCRNTLVSRELQNKFCVQDLTVAEQDAGTLSAAPEELSTAERKRRLCMLSATHRDMYGDVGIQARVEVAKVIKTRVKDVVQRCSLCHSGGARLRCGKCRDVYYCSAECQKAHWKTHKGVCGILGATTASCTRNISVLPAVRAEDRRLKETRHRVGLTDEGFNNLLNDMFKSDTPTPSPTPVEQLGSGEQLGDELFAPGSAVFVGALQTEVGKQINGRRGRMCGIDAKTGRYMVDLGDGGLKKLKRTNVFLVPMVLAKSNPRQHTCSFGSNEYLQSAMQYVDFSNPNTYPTALDTLGQVARVQAVAHLGSDKGPLLPTFSFVRAKQGQVPELGTLAMSELTESEADMQATAKELIGPNGALTTVRNLRYLFLHIVAGRCLLVQVACYGGFRQWRLKLRANGTADESENFRVSDRRSPLDLRDFVFKLGPEVVVQDAKQDPSTASTKHPENNCNHMKTAKAKKKTNKRKKKKK